MPVNHAIWTVDKSPQLLAATRMPSEALLEEMIIQRPDILSGEWMLIGKQERTDADGRIDLLAITPDASLVLIELKRGRTPREVVAQALDYAAWVAQLTPDRIAQIYQRFSNGGDLAKAFKQRFGEELDEDALNQSHQIILVAAELDGASERIITYLNERGIPINVIFFQVFESGTQQLLSRAWLIDPGTTQANASSGTSRTGERESWNGEYYVSFGGKSRSWDEARQFGFISGGGGSWYSQTLKLLKPGDRVWVKIPKTGFVGVGRVTESVRPVDDFMVKTPEGEKSLLEVSRHAEVYEQRKSDPDKAEYFVGVEWLDAVPEQKAFNEIGLFGNQNTVCQPRTLKWRHTIERLKQAFPAWNAS